MVKSPARWADKQIKRGGESEGEYELGVSEVTESPTAKAANKLDKAKAGYIKAVDTGLMKKKLLGVSLEEWRAKTLAKKGRFGEGIRAAESNIRAFAEKAAPKWAEIQRMIDAMPDVTDADKEARSLKWQRETRKLKGTF